LQLHNKDFKAASRDSEDDLGLPAGIDIEGLLRVVRRQWLVVAAAAVAAIAVGVIYVFTAIPFYSSSLNVLIDRSSGEVANQFSTVQEAPPSMNDESEFLSEVEILRSDAIALTVVDKLNLINNAAFKADQQTLIGNLVESIRSLAKKTSWFSSGADAETSDDVKRAKATAHLLKELAISRVGRTYVIQVDYSSASPQLASQIVNAFGDAYLLDKLNSKYDATRRASGWLQDRIAELRQKSVESDLAVQKFRTANGLVAAGSVQVADQQLTELNSAMIVAQSDTARAQARLDRIQQIIQSGQSDAIVTDVLGSSVSNDLRQKYLDASKREAQIAARLGPDHAQAVRLRSEMAEYQRLMFEELNRIAESYKSDLDVAQAREKELTESVAQATGVSATSNETQVQLRELEREADTYRNLYQTFLQRYQAAIQQQSFPITDARIITRGVVSDTPSYPKKPVVLALFAILGAAVGGGIGAFREFRDRFFRTGDQVRDSLGLEFLGMASVIPAKPLGVSKDYRPAPNDIVKMRSTSNYVIDHPLSSFAETMRSAKVAIDMGLPNLPCKIIGVVSSLPGEGKSTLAMNLAELLANQGNRTILIDGDLRNPGATREFATHATAGLLETLIDGRDPRGLLLRNSKTGLAFLPSVIRHRVPHSSELLASPAMRATLAALSAEADYIIIDLPPLGPVVDSRAISTQLDGFIFVAEWGRTARRAARQLLSSEPEIYAKCLGAILNKVDMDKMKLYRAHGSTEYYHSRYATYYGENS
jgi:succinoglycan biosynthesis transport protein ExoP